VLLSSHILGEVSQLCDRVTIIRDGRTVQTNTMAEITGSGAESLEELFLSHYSRSAK
jgi:ABC-2 type transport system ATP-binding protein